jgi:hypothetical protein
VGHEAALAGVGRELAERAHLTLECGALAGRAVLDCDTIG